MRRDVRHKICYSRLRICKEKYIDRDVTKKLMFGTYIRFKGKQDLTNKFHTVYYDIPTNFGGLSYDLKTILRLKAAKAEASSIYSQSAFRKLGFETLACYPYEDYCGKDSDGNNVFSGTGIHKTIDFMSRKIPCFKNTIL